MNFHRAASKEKLKPLVTTRRLFKEMWSDHPWVSASLLATLAVRGAIPALELIVLGRLVDQTKGVVQGSIGLREPAALLALFLVLMALRNLLHLIRETLEDYLRDVVSESLQRRVYEKASRLELSFFEHKDSYDQLQRAREALGLRFANILSSALTLAEYSVTIIALFGALAAAHPLLGPIVVITALPTLWMKMTRTRHQFGWAFDTAPLRRRMEYFLGLVTQRRTAKETRLFGLSSHVRELWEADHRTYREGQLNQARQEMRVQQRAELMLTLVFAGAALYMLHRVTGGALSIGMYVVLIQGVIRLQQETDAMTNLVREVYLLSLNAANLFDFLDRPPEHSVVRDSADAQREPSVGRPFPSPLKEGIRFDDVWFRYPASEDWALRGVTFELRAGETLSLVGRNGAGKSTLVKLLVGLYRPQKGRILVDGIPLDELNEEEFRSRVSAVFQDFSKFELSLRESIGLGNIERIDDLKQIERVATLAGVDEIARQLPQGYETLLSKPLGGTDLSGGQWQKVAVARSLMRDAELLILDEPTASLDPRAEVAVFEEFDRLSAGRTTLLISHRIGTARLADRIIVLSDGEIVESGDHEKLVQSRGVYSELFHLQKQWYIPGEEASTDAS